LKKLEKLLYSLVSINSTNLDYSKDALGEKEIGDFIFEYFKKNKVDCIKQKVADDRNNIIAKIDGNKDKGIILFCSHLDTVHIDGMNFKPRIVDGKMYGPGSCDAKASLASMINTFIEIKRLNLEVPDLYFAGVISEESMHLGIKKFLMEYKNINKAIIGEPTNMDIGIAHKGCLRFRIKVKGKSAHGSTPESGINAIYNMAKLINNIVEKIIPENNKKYHKTLGSPTINIGKIVGGEAFNIVPDFCFIEIDRRIIPEENFNEVINDFSRLIEDIKKENDTFFAEIEDPIDYIPCLETNKNKKIVETAYNACLNFKDNVEVIGLPYSTDGGYLSELNIPTIVLGPGSIEVCHKLEEYVLLEQVALSSEIYKDIIFRN